MCGFRHLQLSKMELELYMRSQDVAVSTLSTTSHLDLNENQIVASFWAMHMSVNFGSYYSSQLNQSKVLNLTTLYWAKVIGLFGGAEAQHETIATAHF
jgi:hypothetical protein